MRLEYRIHLLVSPPPMKWAKHTRTQNVSILRFSQSRGKKHRKRVCLSRYWTNIYYITEIKFTKYSFAFVRLSAQHILFTFCHLYCVRLSTYRFSFAHISTCQMMFGRFIVWHFQFCLINRHTQTHKHLHVAISSSQFWLLLTLVLLLTHFSWSICLFVEWGGIPTLLATIITIISSLKTFAIPPPLSPQSNWHSKYVSILLLCAFLLLLFLLSWC